MKIGYIYNAYPEKRCIIDKTNESYIYYNLKRNIKYLMKSLLQHLRIIEYWDKQAVVSLPSKKCDVWHTFNQIPKSKSPYIITFETAVPRNSSTVEREWEFLADQKIYATKQNRKQIKMLLSDKCISLLPLSNSALRIQEEQLRHLGCDDQEIDLIKKKMKVVYPPQKIMVDEKLENKYRDISKCLQLVFVGNNFWRKGGDIIVDSIKALGIENRVQLTIISNFGRDDIFKVSETERADFLDYVENAAYITSYCNIDNNQVMEIIQKSHVGFLPTMGDTFGYSVLEMQACGVPVVSTDIRALSEINNNDAGWIIEVDKHPISGEAFYHDKITKEKLKRDIMQGVTKCLEEIIEMAGNDNQQYFIDKSKCSVNRIKEYHDPDKYNECLVKEYEKCKEINNVSD